jgi:hypothetical protein
LTKGISRSFVADTKVSLDIFLPKESVTIFEAGFYLGFTQDSSYKKTGYFFCTSKNKKAYAFYSSIHVCI